MESLRIPSTERGRDHGSLGKNVRAKPGLGKAILDQGWGKFRRQQDYKMACNGGNLLAGRSIKQEPAAATHAAFA